VVEGLKLEEMELVQEQQKEQQKEKHQGMVGEMLVEWGQQQAFQGVVEIWMELGQK
jgi:hypothetical protein